MAKVSQKTVYKYPSDRLLFYVDPDKKSVLYVTITFDNWTKLDRSDARELLEWLKKYLQWSAPKTKR